MNENHRHSFISSWIIVFAVLPTAISGQTRKQTPQTWQADPILTKTLKPSLDLDWFSIRIPLEYTAVQPPNATTLKEAGIKVNAWTKKTAGEGFAPTLTVMFLPAKHLKNPDQITDAREVFDGLVKSLSSGLNDVIQTPIKTGRWNGQSAFRFDFSGRSRTGQSVSGMAILVSSDAGFRIVSTLHPTDTPSASEKANHLTASALSVLFQAQ